MRWLAEKEFVGDEDVSWVASGKDAEEGVAEPDAELRRKMEEKGKAPPTGLAKPGVVGGGGWRPLDAVALSWS
jgi:hypothetical protein